MKNFNMTVANRLWLMVAIAVISLIVVGIAGVLSTRDLSSKLRSVNEETIPALDALASVQNALSLMQGQILLHLTYYEPEQTAEVDKQIGATRESLKKSFEAYAALAADPAEKALFEADRAAYAAYDAVFMKAWEQAKENSKLVAREIIVTECMPKAKAVSDSIAKHIASAKGQADAARVAAEAASTRTTTTVWSLIALGVVLVLFLAHRLIRRIAGQLLMMRDSIRSVESSMDFTQRIALDTQDELGSTARAFNRLLAKLQDSFGTLAESATTVLDSADAVSRTTAQVATSAEAQSGAASHMAASIEQFDRQHRARRRTRGRIGSHLEGIRAAGTGRRARHRADGPGYPRHRRRRLRFVGAHPRTRRSDKEDFLVDGRHRRHRQPDATVGAERGHRSGARRRAGARLRGGRR
ncbi:MAG: methyl-accepting chemotaxis protein [Propionivibrio sp.]